MNSLIAVARFQLVAGGLAYPQVKAASESAPEEIRTPNLLIRSQMLYPLSYGRICSIVYPGGGGERI
jgi:hypothetical protein